MHKTKFTLKFTSPTGLFEFIDTDFKKDGLDEDEVILENTYKSGEIVFDDMKTKEELEDDLNGTNNE